MLQREIERLQAQLAKKQKTGLLRNLRQPPANAAPRVHEEKKSKPAEESRPTIWHEPKTSSTHREKSRRSGPRWTFPKVSIRSLGAFSGVSVAILLLVFGLISAQRLVDLRGRVLDISVKAFDQLVVAGQAATESDYDLAQTKFVEASDTFVLAQKELNRNGRSLLNVLKYLPVKGQVLSSGEHLLDAGRDISLAGQDLTEIVQLLNPELATSEDFLQERSVIDLLADIRQYLEPARAKLASASGSLAAVDPASLPPEYRDSVSQMSEQLPELVKTFDRFLSFSELFHAMLGGDESKRYLFIFQNNREMRATGGFIGSIALIDVVDGQIKEIEVPGGGPYDLTGQLKERVIAPAPLHLVNPHWYLQDANWFPDFPTSAEKVMWFYEKSGGPTVDGVISLTPEIVTNLLAITGPIDMQSEYGVTVTSENFITETLLQVERKYDPVENKPKQFIADLLPTLLERIFQSNQEQFLAIVDSFSQSLTNQELLVYLQNEELQNRAREFGWTGEIKQTKGDYLMIVNTNIGGGKTDEVIDQLIDHQVTVQTDGSLTAKLQITRIHNGVSGDEFSGVKNVDFMRVYVPEGSRLLSADGFQQPDPKLFFTPAPEYEVDEFLANVEGQVIIDERTGTRINTEFDKTVFGNWVQVEPGQSVTVTLEYQLPFSLKLDTYLGGVDSYSLFVQKQSGSFPSVLHSRLEYPAAYQVGWYWPENEEVRSESGGFSIDTILQRNYIFGAVFEK